MGFYLNFGYNFLWYQFRDLKVVLGHRSQLVQLIKLTVSEVRCPLRSVNVPVSAGIFYISHCVRGDDESKVICLYVASCQTV